MTILEWLSASLNAEVRVFPNFQKNNALGKADNVFGQLCVYIGALVSLGSFKNYHISL